MVRQWLSDGCEWAGELLLKLSARLLITTGPKTLRDRGLDAQDSRSESVLLPTVDLSEKARQMRVDLNPRPTMPPARTLEPVELMGSLEDRIKAGR